MAALGGHKRKVHAGASAAYYRDPLAALCFCQRSRQNVFKSGAGIDCALRMSAFHKFVDTSLLATDAGPNLLYASGIGLAAPIGVCQQRPAQHDHVRHAIPQRLFHKIRIAQFANGYDGYRKSGIGTNITCRKIFLCHLAELQKAAGIPDGGCGSHQLS